MKIILELPSGLTLQQHLRKYYGKRDVAELSKQEAEDIAESVKWLMKKCAIVIKDNDGNFIEGVML